MNTVKNRRSWLFATAVFFLIWFTAIISSDAICAFPGSNSNHMKIPMHFCPSYWEMSRCQRISITHLQVCKKLTWFFLQSPRFSTWFPSPLFPLIYPSPSLFHFPSPHILSPPFLPSSLLTHLIIFPSSLILFPPGGGELIQPTNSSKVPLWIFDFFF